MKPVIIDTNILLRFLLKDVPDQTVKIRNKFKKARAGFLKIIIPQIVIFEVVFALTSFYHFSKERVIRGLETIISTSYLATDNQEIFIEALKLYREKSISFVDSFLLAKIKHDGAELFTFDKKLQKLASIVS